MKKNQQPKNQEELKSKLIELRKELMKLNSQKSSGTSPENPGNIRKLKREIARTLTFLNQHESHNSGFVKGAKPLQHEGGKK